MRKYNSILRGREGLWFVFFFFLFFGFLISQFSQQWPCDTAIFAFPLKGLQKLHFVCRILHWEVCQQQKPCYFSNILWTSKYYDKQKRNEARKFEKIQSKTDEMHAYFLMRVCLLHIPKKNKLPKQFRVPNLLSPLRIVRVCLQGLICILLKLLLTVVFYLVLLAISQNLHTKQ